MERATLAEWNGNIADARALQMQLAEQVSLRDDFPLPLRTIAGFDVGFEQGGAVTRAAAVLLDAQTLQPLHACVARAVTRMPYIPGLLGFRELPALLDALALLPQAPDLAFVDGHGIAHPRRLGVAAHFGVVTGLPCIGVAKKVLVGSYDEPGAEPGDRTQLRHKGDLIGMVVRSKRRCRPLIVSPGHRVSIDNAVELVLRTITRYRLPEPTRLADRLASRRDEAAATASMTGTSKNR